MKGILAYLVNVTWYIVKLGILAGLLFLAGYSLVYVFLFFNMINLFCFLVLAVTIFIFYLYEF